MKNTLMFILLALTYGCERPPETQRQEFTSSMVEYYGENQYGLLTNALAKATNKDDVLPIIAGQIEAQSIENLSHAAPSALYKLLESANHQTGNYTRHEIIEAMKLHNSYEHTKKVKIPEGE